MNDLLCISDVITNGLALMLRHLVDLADTGRRFFALEDNHVHHRLGRRHRRMELAVVRVDGSEAYRVLQQNL